MALSGSTAKQYTSKGAYWVWVEWSGTQNIANNTTTITAITYAATNSYGWYATSNNGSSVTVNGATTSAGDSGDVAKNTTKRELCRRTEVVSHNADGTKSVTISGRWWMNGTAAFDLTSTGTFTLDTIPRTSTPTLSTSSQAIGSAITIYTNRASTSFTHTISYTFGSASGTIATGVGDSVAWALPTALANQIPTTTSGTGSITCSTYSGSTLIGTKVVSFTVTVPDTASYRPTASTPSTSIYGSGRDKTIAKYVQGISSVTVSFAATAQGGASITSSYINVRRQTDSGNSMNISGTSGTSGTLTLPGTYLITATTTDSRGRSTSSTTTFVVEAYAVPKINSYTAVRNSTTKTTVNNNASGTYTYMGGSNSLTVVIAKKTIAETSFTNLNTTSGTTSGTFSNTFASTGNTETVSYHFRVTITDTFGNSATSIVTVSTSSFALSIKRDTGIGVGKIWEQGALDVGGPVYFNGINQSTFGPNRVYGDGNALSFWHRLETGTYFVQPGDIVGQPADWGFMQVSKASIAGASSDFNVLWFTQAGGAVYRKSGNSSTITDWVKIPMNGDSYMVLSGGPIYYGVQGSGSNSNGRYLSFGDGTLICWAERTFSTTVTLAWGSLFYHDVQSWTFPHAFAGAKPVCSATYVDAGAELIGMVPNSTLTNITFYGLRPTSVSAYTAFNVRLMAIGRWK